MSRPDPRLEPLLEVMLAIARQDFDVRAPVGDGGDAIDAVAVGLNMLCEELREEVASRRELERAHADLKRVHGQLAHAGKLAAIGHLAAGVAHEMNNPIQGISVCLSILERSQAQLLGMLGSREPLDREAVRERIMEGVDVLSDAHEAIERVRGVSASLRTFARIDDDSLSAVDLGDVIRVSARLSESLARRRAQVELDLAPVPPVWGSRGKLGQVVTNLLVNALQAVPERDAERQRVRLRLRAADGQVILAVEDSGPGVPAELWTRIFEPFYSTKADDLGTGLGLSLASDILALHGGSIRVDKSELGGARFEVTLPVAAAREATPAPPPKVGPTRRPRVLLVDDEEVLLRLFERLLADDCDVVTASSGDEALRILAEDPSFDRVVCDLEMPSTDGIDVFEATLRASPTLAARFVFATGGAVTARGRAFLDGKDARVLHKPFQPAALLASILAGMPE